MDSTVVTVEFERTSRRCWNKFGGESLFALYSPFFVSLAAGNLSPRAFGNCIYQDYHFLRVLFAAYAPSYHTLIRLVFRYALAEENCEDGEYETVIVQEFKNSALQKVDTYEKLVQGIQNNLDPSHTPNIYKKWIDYYSSRDFKVLVSRNEYVLDKLSRCLDGGEIEVVDQLYHRALRLQIEFFADLPMDRPTLVPILRLEDRSRQLDIFFDYEKTCIVIDSAVVLAEAKMRICEIFGMPSATFSNKLRQQVFDFDGLWRALKQVAECERRANARLVESRLLHNLGLDDINCAASIVILRKGCKEFFQKIVEDKSPNVNVHVVSYCCSDLMRFVFPPVILRRRQTETKHVTVCIGGDVGDLLCLLWSRYRHCGQFIKIKPNESGASFWCEICPPLPCLGKEAERPFRGQLRHLEIRSRRSLHRLLLA
ncbi:hypothetical protein TIFTF001_041458 [Ficus carica]|uniref:Uncharacterized protein n=1 Tax=Ficus carica TaxID=3494 RepID=A0AA87Z6F3_FICCA|nr:hypothetical protein TIFTF001_041458 [Ficus carica]